MLAWTLRHTHIHIYIYTHTYTRMHTHTKTYMHVPMQIRRIHSRWPSAFRQGLQLRRCRNSGIQRRTDLWHCWLRRKSCWLSRRRWWQRWWLWRWHRIRNASQRGLRGKNEGGNTFFRNKYLMNIVNVEWHAWPTQSNRDGEMMLQFIVLCYFKVWMSSCCIFTLLPVKVRPLTPPL